ncbi:MAG: SRPBCC family protein [Actinomycetota bacterium]|nr:SRPBCC family protein [Actinomycetota bacterium]
MKVLNVHERALPASREEVGALVDRLDTWWPRDRWPALRPKPSLEVGATSKRGPIREHIVEHVPGERLVFQIDAPHGLDAQHRFEVVSNGAGTLLRHTVKGEARGKMAIAWPLAIGPLHDATLEDLLDCAEAEITGEPRPARPFSRPVRVLRWGFEKGMRK